MHISNISPGFWLYIYTHFKPNTSICVSTVFCMRNEHRLVVWSPSPLTCSPYFVPSKVFAVNVIGLVNALK